VALVEVIRPDVDPELPERARAADAEEDLLRDAALDRRLVEPVGDPRILLRRRLEEEERAFPQRSVRQTRASTSRAATRTRTRTPVSTRKSAAYSGNSSTGAPSIRSAAASTRAPSAARRRRPEDRGRAPT
jgi:hypothetical protein